MCSQEDTFWHNTLDAFEGQPEFATAMAINFADLRDKISSKRGVQETRAILEDAIALIFPHTHFHGACEKLYHRYISKRSLVPSDDPVIIVGNLEEAERERKAKLKRKRMVKATKKRRPAFRLVKGKKAA